MLPALDKPLAAAAGRTRRRRTRRLAAGAVDRRPAESADGAGVGQPRSGSITSARAWCARRTTSASPARSRRTRSCSTGSRVGRLVAAAAGSSKRAAPADPDSRTPTGSRRSIRKQDEYARTDAGNRLWWRAERRRLDAEALRDSLLFAAGNLNLDGRRRPELRPGRSRRTPSKGCR